MEKSRRKRTVTERIPPSAVVVEDEEEVQRPLKLALKLSVPDIKSAAIFEECLNLETTEYVVKTLLQLNDSVYPRILEDWKKGLEGIQKLWHKHSDHASICYILINVLMKLLPQIDDLSHDHQTFLLSLINHASPEIQALALKCWGVVADRLPREFSNKCLEKTIETVYSSHHVVRIECLNLIGQLSHVAPSHQALLLLVTEFCNDSDARVRKASVNALLAMHHKDLDVGLDTYAKASELLQDDDESVREAATNVIYSLGLKLAECAIPLSSGSDITLRVEDDAFIKMCDLVTDSSIAVRSLATSLLGQFRQVSERFLQQTLDKKLMSHLKVVKSDHERSLEKYQGGVSVGGGSRDWDTGQRWGGGVPKLELNPSELTLMRSGACGAFVHSLEDEYMEVRSAAVISMGQLCSHSKQFASSSLDYLVDMFNDEIEMVRLQAINCLRQVSSTIHLREDQLETSLGVLQESSQEIREGLHDLLSTCRIMSVRGLHLTVHALLDNLKKYPHDRQSIWHCLHMLGNSHAHLVSILAPELLSIHPYLMTKEPDVEDPAYICVLILVFNAAVHNTTLCPLFPSHVIRHYHYLRDSIPDLIPHIKLNVTTPTSVTPPPKKTSVTSSEEYLKRLLLRAINSAQSHDPTVTKATINHCISDLVQLGGVDKTIKGCTKLSSQILQCQMLVNKIRVSVGTSILTTPQPNDVATDIKELILLSYRLQYGYSGHTPSLLLVLHWLRVIGHANLMLLAIQLDWHNRKCERFNIVRLGMMERLQCVERVITAHDLVCPPSLDLLMNKEVKNLSIDQLSLILQNINAVCVLSHLKSSDLLPVHQCDTTITEPLTNTSDTTYKFLSSLALSLPLYGTINHVKDTSCLSVRVKFPDGRQLYFPVKLSDVRPSKDNFVQKLNTTLILSHGNWTDANVIQLQVVIRYPLDTPSDTHCLSALDKLSHKGGVAKISSVDCKPFHYQWEDGGVLMTCMKMIDHTSSLQHTLHVLRAINWKHL